MLTVVREEVAVQEQLENIGAALRDARLKLSLTQGEIGEQAGVSRQLVSRIEQGCNGEFSAYIAVARAVRLRIALVEETSPADTDSGAVNAQFRLIY